MQILVLSDRIFSPLRGDGLRFAGLFRPLAEKHVLDLLCFGEEGDQLPSEIRPIFRKVILVPAPPSRRSSLLKRAVKAFTAVDFVRTSEEMGRTIVAALAKTRYDVIYDAGAYSIPNVPITDVPIVVDSVDEAILRELRALRGAGLGDGLRHIRKTWQWWLYERTALRRAAENLYASELDARVYQRLFPRRPVETLPNGVDLSFFSAPARRPDPAFVIFEGNMFFPPNVDAATRLVNEISPLLRKLVPQLRIGLVGREPVLEVKCLTSDSVEVTGTVADIRPYLSRATVFACPMRLGSGIKNKILQAWAMSVPVVATTESLGGLSAVDGLNILVRDTNEDFAAAVAELISNPALAAKIGAAGRATVEREYSWERQAQKLEQILLNAASASRFRRALDAESTTASEAGPG